MTIYDIEVDVPDDAAPGLQAMCDIVFGALARELGLNEHTLGVSVKGPPELRLGWRWGL